jgi:voltage-gated sodium channel type IV alpha
VTNFFFQLRLMRVFKLAQSWDTLRRILAIIISTLGALANLTVVLLIIMYVFAVLGFQLFSNTYTTEIFGDSKPRSVL